MHFQKFFIISVGKIYYPVRRLENVEISTLVNNDVKKKKFSCLLVDDIKFKTHLIPSRTCTHVRVRDYYQNDSVIKTAHGKYFVKKKKIINMRYYDK